MRKILSVILSLTVVLGLVPAMSLTASAAIQCSSYYVFMNETENYKVGQIANIPASRYTADLASSDYGVQNTYTYSFSDSSMVKVSGEKVTFVKEGTLTLTIKHNQKFERTGKTSSHTDTIKINVSTEPIQTTNIKLDSGTFSGGKEFPAFTVVNDENCYVEEATFYKEMCDYYVGDTLPSYRAGTTINYVSITLKPKAGYFFGWGGTSDGKKHESNVYTVEYKGKKYVPNVVHDQTNSELHVYVDVTFEEGQIYATTFKELDAPYHCGPLDKTVTTNSDVELVSVKYTMFGKELTEFKKGDTVGITVRVKSKDPKNTFHANGYAYWMEQKMNSVNTKLISATEAEYTFTYKVDAIESQIIKWADFTIPGVYAGEPLPANAFSATDGITVKSVTWTPNDAKADANKEYTVKIRFAKEDEFVYASDFAEQGVVSINGERAKFVAEASSSGGGVKGKFATTNYYAELTFTPITTVNIGTSTDVVIGNKIPTQEVYVGTTVQTNKINLTYDKSEYTAEQGERVMLDFSHDMDLSKCTNVRYQWYKSTDSQYGTGQMIEGGDKKQLAMHTFDIGTFYYYCIMYCTVDGKEYNSDYTGAPVIKTTVVASTAGDFKLNPVGATEIVSKDGKISLKATAEGQGKRDVSYAWRMVEADGSFEPEFLKYQVISQTDTLIAELPYDKKAGDIFYYMCGAGVFGDSDSIIYKVTYLPEVWEEEGEEQEEEKFTLSPVGSLDVFVSSSNEEIILQATVTETDKMADFQWYRIDANGNVIDEKNNGGIPLSMGDRLTIGAIPVSEKNVPRYYKCAAMIGNTLKSIVFKVTLTDSCPFADVKSSDWYYASVISAHEMGLINGKSANEYKPDDNMTYAEAVKLAVCMNILYNGGNPNKDITTGKDVWYSTYMDYALEHGIIDDDLTPYANEKITRKEYVNIFSKALPEKAFAKKNNIPSGSIPDVKEEKTAQDKAIYMFYRAGILSGVDTKGTFNSDDNIKRSEVAAILIRMMEPTARVGASKELGK